MSRVLLNDPRVAKTITQHFVPASGEIERLQPSRYSNPASEASRWFQTMAKAALKKYAPPEWWEQFRSYQGLYFVGADGTCYGYQIVGELPAKKYLGILDDALKKLADKPPKQVSISNKSIAAARFGTPDASTCRWR